MIQNSDAKWTYQYLLATESMQDHKQHRDNITMINQQFNLTKYKYSSDPNKHNM
jgi:hypothetical protein